MVSLIYWFILYIYLVLSQENEKEFGITDRWLNVDGNTPGAEKCLKSVKCDADCKYRTIDGTCNNLNIPGLGSTNATYLRLLPAQYQDGIHEIRKGVNGKDLPNVRKISTTLYQDVYIPNNNNNLVFMMWSVATVHDSASTRFPRIKDCCPNGQFPDPPVPQCYQIRVPDDDPYFSQMNVTCLNYTRLHTTSSYLNCPLTPKQQFSQVTQWQDLSYVYRMNDDLASSVREHKGGRLVTQRVGSLQILPPSKENNEFCASHPKSCVNPDGTPYIVLISTVLTHEHNRLADELSQLNRGWDDERLYQEARRINIALTQHITYSEYMPHILDPVYINGMNLSSLKTGFTEYNPNITGGTITEFSGSVFRTFHSVIPPYIRLIGKNTESCPFSSAPVERIVNDSGNLDSLCFDKVAHGMAVEPTKMYCRYMTKQITNLFRKADTKYGEDLESIAMTRGRDLGLPSYNRYRSLCGLTSFSSFQQLSLIMEPKIVKALEELYDDVDDIDLYVGVLLEKPVSVGRPGPLGQCIMAQQWARWKFGDRFFYEHQNQSGSFTPEQLEVIRKVTISSLLCRNTKIKQIQEKGFSPPSETNKLISCDQIPSISLEAWKE